MGASRVFIPRMLLGAPMMGQCLMAGCKESHSGNYPPNKFLMSRIYYSTVLLLFEFPQKTCTHPLGKLITEFTSPRLSVSYFLYTLYEVEELLIGAVARSSCTNGVQEQFSPSWCRVD